MLEIPCQSDKISRRIDNEREFSHSEKLQEIKMEHLISNVRDTKQLSMHGLGLSYKAY